MGNGHVHNGIITAIINKDIPILFSDSAAAENHVRYMNLSIFCYPAIRAGGKQNWDIGYSYKLRIFPVV